MVAEQQQQQQQRDEPLVCKDIPVHGKYLKINARNVVLKFLDNPISCKEIRSDLQLDQEIISVYRFTFY